MRRISASGSPIASAMSRTRGGRKRSAAASIGSIRATASRPSGVSRTSWPGSRTQAPSSATSFAERSDCSIATKTAAGSRGPRQAQPLHPMPARSGLSAWKARASRAHVALEPRQSGEKRTACREAHSRAERPPSRRSSAIGRARGRVQRPQDRRKTARDRAAPRAPPAGPRAHARRAAQAARACGAGAPARAGRGNVPPPIVRRAVVSRSDEAVAGRRRDRTLEHELDQARSARRDRPRRAARRAPRRRVAA